jgi:hypothetical protein
MNFAYKYLFHAVGIFNMPYLRSKSCYGFLSPLKMRRPRPGLNPQILGVLVSTITTRPPRMTNTE